MESTASQQVREVIVDNLKDSSLKKLIKYKEVEVVYPGSVEVEISLSGRVDKSKQLDLEEFRENLFDLLADKCGNELATKFIEESFKVEVGLSEGEKFKELDGFDMDGKKVDIKSESGKVLLIDFWATWCKYCQKPMQENIDLVNSKSDLKDVSIIGLSCDENVAQWKNHINERKWNVIPQYVKQGLLKQLGIVSIPCIAIVNKEGDIVYFGHPGGIKLEETLVSLSEGKSVVLTATDEVNANAWWSDIDSKTKMDLVSQSNLLLKDAGVINANFCVTTKYSLDIETFSIKPVKTSPIFYGEVTPFEFDTIKATSSAIQKSYNFNYFVYNVKVMQIGFNEDF